MGMGYKAKVDFASLNGFDEINIIDTNQKL
jgi:hypothetical protein